MLKYDKIAEPDMYLGAIFSKMLLKGSKTCCNIFSGQYVNAVVAIAE